MSTGGASPRHTISKLLCVLLPGFACCKQRQTSNVFSMNTRHKSLQGKKKMLRILPKILWMLLSSGISRRYGQHMEALLKSLYNSKAISFCGSNFEAGHKHCSAIGMYCIVGKVHMCSLDLLYASISVCPCNKWKMRVELCRQII